MCRCFFLCVADVVFVFVFLFSCSCVRLLSTSTSCGVVWRCGFLVLVGCFLCLGFLVGCLWVLGVVLGCFLFKMS